MHANQRIHIIDNGTKCSYRGLQVCVEGVPTNTAAVANHSCMCERIK